MTIFQFDNLPVDKQLKVLWRHGELIGERQKEKNKYMLFQLSSFYAEVRYCKSINEINNVRSFVSTDKLRPYLNSIDITGIFEA